MQDKTNLTAVLGLEFHRDKPFITLGRVLCFAQFIVKQLFQHVVQ